jgi:3-hydroxybutyryl-CoA dehydrogenase
MKNIAVIGSGTMGNGIAHVFAQNGFQVQLVDISESALQRGMDTIAKNLDRMVAKGTIDAASKDLTLANITPQTDLKKGLAQCDLVVEAATENIDLKLKIFAQMDEAAPAHAILATNTSSISITRIAAATRRPNQVIGMHFMNPVPVMKLVEIIRGYSTSDAVAQAVATLSEQLGKVPVA